MPQFDRIAAVTVGPEAGAGVRVDQRLRIAFRSIKTVSKETNSISVQIYGLNESTRQQILRNNQVLQLEAGYADRGLEVLAIADVTRAIVRRDRTEVVTEIECEDGARALRDRKINLSFSAGTEVQRVLDRIAQELALGERATGATAEGEYLQGVSFSGPVGDVLDRVTGKAGLTWSIQDRLLQILDRVDDAQGRGVILTPQTGLIDSPEPIDDEDDIDERRRGAGYRFRCQLQPKIRPGAQVIIEAADVARVVLRVDSVEHVGDTRGSDWYSEAVAYEEP